MLKSPDPGTPWVAQPACEFPAGLGELPQDFRGGLEFDRTLKLGRIF